MEALSSLISAVIGNVGILATMMAVMIASEILRSRWAGRVAAAAFEFVAAILDRLTFAFERRSVIHRVPGHRMERLLRLIMPSKLFNELFGQTIADARQEYTEAICRGDLWEARLIKLYLTLSVFKVIVVGIGVGLAKKAVEIWKIGS